VTASLRSFLESPGLRLVPVGGRPPKTGRDVAVFLALKWFEASAQAGRPKLRERVVDLWLARGYVGISDPAHVTARIPNARKACGDDNRLMVFRGEGTTNRHIGSGAGALLVPEASVRDGEGAIHFCGPLWTWAFGAEQAEHFDATGSIEFKARNGFLSPKG
jgi:hypothetical protein